jgi:hypothetical protein
MPQPPELSGKKRRKLIVRFISSLTPLKWIKRLLAKLKVKPRTLQISLLFPVLNE